eukprot:6470126-Amphidinium_carterae.2
MLARDQPNLAKYLAPEHLGLWPVTSTAELLSLRQLETMASFKTTAPATDRNNGEEHGAVRHRSDRMSLKTWNGQASLPKVQNSQVHFQVRRDPASF